MLYRGLPAQFPHERAGALGQISPGPALEDSPDQEIELAGIRGIEDLDVVRAIGGQLNFIDVRRPDRRGTIVGLEDGVAIIHVAQPEHTELRERCAVSPWFG